MKKDLRIIYMGTPEFAVPSLAILVENGLNVVAVVTAPDKPKGRGQKLSVSQVKEYAMEKGIPILQPTNLKDDNFVDELASYEADLQVVVAFRMLPKVVWSMPSLGTINLHASLLPKYRGAAPINWAIINGEKETGITTFFIQEEIDTGDILFQEKEKISSTDSVGILYERLIVKGAALVLKTVNAITEDEYTESPQVFEDDLPSAPKLNKDNTRIDWDASAENIRNQVRGLSPYPSAWTEIKGKKCKLYDVELIEDADGISSGTVVTNNKSHIYIKAKDAFVSLKVLQMEGKKRMDVVSFLNGNQL